jgi:ribonuclease E
LQAESRTEIAAPEITSLTEEVSPAAPDGLQPMAPQSPTPGQPGAPRKRRRRRGKRGSGSSSTGTSQGAQQTAPDTASSIDGDDRFGTPNEIDTTPPPVHIEQDKASSIATPNAASAPVWSLNAEDAPRPTEEAAKADDEPKHERALETTAMSDTPPQPAKKGWWQRTFKASE